MSVLLEKESHRLEGVSFENTLDTEALPPCSISTTQLGMKIPSTRSSFTDLLLNNCRVSPRVAYKLHEANDWDGVPLRVLVKILISTLAFVTQRQTAVFDHAEPINCEIYVDYSWCHSNNLCTRGH